MKFQRRAIVAFLLILSGLFLTVTTIYSAPTYVTFDWSTAYNNSIRAYLQPANNWTWATSEILSPNPRQLGAWKWSAPYNWTRAYVVTNIEGSYETYKVCTGRTSSDPGDPYQLFNDPRNRCFKVWRTSSSSVDWVEVFNIYGQVKDNNGAGISGVTISLNTGASTTTDSKGKYSFVNLESGSYTLTPSKNGYTFSPSSRTVSGGPDYHVTDQNFTGTNRASISGRVTDKGGGPIAGVTISDGAGHTTTTDSHGNYKLSDLNPGTYTITPSKPEHQFSPSSRTVTVPPDATSQNFIDGNRYSIFGKITDGSGNSIADVPVLCQGLTESFTTKTDKDGNYVFGDLVPGFYQLKSTSGSPYTLTPSRRIIVITSSSSRGQDFTTTPLYGILGGKVTDQETGKAIRNARISVAGHVARTDSQGNYSIQDVLPGNHTIRVSVEDYNNYKGTVTVKANQSNSYNVKLQPKHREGYYLPYPGGSTYKCTQGNNGEYSHQTRWDKYAFDFGTWYDTIVASREGRVIKVDVGRCNGNYIKIRHSDGTETLYAHLSRISVKKNQRVEAGQPIGKSGNTGCVTGPHVHFVRRKANTFTAVRTRFLDESTKNVNGIPQAGQRYKSDNYRTLTQHLSANTPASEAGVIWGDVTLHVTETDTLSLELWTASYLTDVTAIRLATTLDELIVQPWQTYSETANTNYPWNTPIAFAQYRDANGLESDIFSDTIEAITYEPVHAAFSINPTTCVKANTPIINQSFPLCEQCDWQWSFGDGMTSSEMEPKLGDPLFSYQGYQTPGTYTVTLQATSLDNTSVFSQQIQVLPIPSSEFTIKRSDRKSVV
jgi:murein DD-endopeptidase MepM/ murein hydrolase activator NlpD